MADDEHKHQLSNPPETTTSTPSSSVAAQGGLKATKDRSCPFCSQAFTSSSLGRHLDLYIKPKNPKPADGVHDLDEIRKIRGGITRRQPRTSLNKSTDDSSGDGRHETSTVSFPPPARSSADMDPRMSEGSPHVSSVNVRDGRRVTTVINGANWQSTGVINNLPARVPSRGVNGTPTGGQAHRIEQMRRDASGSKLERLDSENYWRLQQAAESGRVAELALREIVASLEAARNKAEPEKRFDFNFFGCTFPTLCLNMLPAPPTLFSSTPFPGLETWTIAPPGLKQFEQLNRNLQALFRKKATTESSAPSSTEVFRYNQHLQAAWELWRNAAPAQQRENWTLEVLRAYAGNQEALKMKETELEMARQRVRYVEAQFDRLSKCQLPREFLLHPPTALPIPPSVVEHLKPGLMQMGEESEWDVDIMLARWKAAMQATSKQPAPYSTHSPQQQTGPPVGLPLPKISSDCPVFNMASHVVGSLDAPNGSRVLNSHGRPEPSHNDWSAHSQADGIDNALVEQAAAAWQTNGGAARRRDRMADTDPSTDDDDDDDEDAEGEAEEEPGRFNAYPDTSSLHRQRDFLPPARQSSNGSDQTSATSGIGSGGILNGNGKRPLAPVSISQSKGPKVYFESSIHDDAHSAYAQPLPRAPDRVDGYGARR